MEIISLLTLCYAALIGLIFGSFASAVSFRLIRNICLFKRSFCTSCDHKLNAWNLIPVISWIAQRGKCHFCKEPISSRYPIIEITTGSLFALIYHYYALSPTGLILYIYVVCMIITIVTDIEEYIALNSMQFFFLILGLAYGVVNDINIVSQLINFIIYLTIFASTKILYKKFRNIDIIGGADVKLIAISSLYLIDLELMLNFFILSGMLGMLTALIWKLYNGKSAFPFTPSILISLFLLIMPFNIDTVLSATIHQFDNIIVSLIERYN